MPDRLLKWVDTLATLTATIFQREFWGVRASDVKNTPRG
ncbi:hypothetical protein FORC82_p489 (plasmid) [Escherichia coli]|uniref:Uncharacterized protein n=2 Tax=Escherichia coli TaxID=562 RepID=A0A173GM59_ECOLX|nr:hypothetical protein MM1_0103 [Escherichia coli chi7122]AKK51530.1 hypothetical protein PPECC33_p3109 [Escherichia coli PCN033]ANH56069.1 hypothetical protein [Escherichia coli]EIH42241.1 hypothetical protein EC970259_B0017 [Escherichia coli 99.0741]QAZ75010.1 hypothetical protein FORC82_p489 [Escherichia coli]